MFSGHVCLRAPASMEYWICFGPPDQCPTLQCPTLSHVLGLWHAWATSVGSVVFGFQLGLAKGGSSKRSEEREWGQGSHSLSLFGTPVPLAANLQQQLHLLVLRIAPSPYSFRPWGRYSSAPLLVAGYFTNLCWFPLTLWKYLIYWTLFSYLVWVVHLFPLRTLKMNVALSLFINLVLPWLL